jgi:THO complex subunit 3
MASHQQNVQTNQITFCHTGKKIFLTTGEGRVKILSYPDFQPIFHLNYDPTTPFTLNGHTSSCLSIEYV